MRVNEKNSGAALFVSVAAAGGVTGVVVGFAAAADISPLLLGLLAGLLSASLGIVTFLLAARVLKG